MDCLLLPAMRGSGSSVLAGCLRHLGVDLGPGDLDQDAGGRENQDIALIHEILLRDLGCSWDMIGALPEGWEESEAAARAGQSLRTVLERQFTEGRLWAVWESRLCRFLPLWEAVLGGLGLHPGCLLTVRHPWETALALQQQCGFDLRKGHLLWLTHYREAMAFCGDKPHAVITFDQLLADPVATLGDVEKRLGIAFPTPLSRRHRHLLDFIRPDLKHHHCGDQRHNGSAQARFSHFGYLYEQVLVRQAQDMLQIPDAPQPPALSPPAQAEQQDERMFQDLLSLVGHFERAERDTALQRERLLLRTARPDHILYVQIFPPAPEPGARADSASIKFLIPREEWQEVRVTLPDSRPLRTQPLRLAPLNTKGTVTISAMQLVNVATDRVLWSASKPDDYDRLGLDHILRLPNQDGLSLVIYSHQARIAFPALPDLPDCPLELRLWIKASNRLDCIAETWERHEREQGRLQSELHQACEQVDTQRRELASREKRLAEADQRVSELERQLAETHNRLSDAETAARDSRRAHEQDLQAKTRALTAAADKEAELTRQLSDAATRASDLERQLGEAVARLSELERQLAETHNRLSDAETAARDSRRAHEQDLQAKARALSEATGQQAELGRRLAEAVKQTSELERQLTEVRDRQSETAAAAQEQQHAYQQELERRDQDIGTLEQRLAELDRGRAERDKQIAALKSVIRRYASGLEQLRSDYLAVKASARWKTGNRLIRGVELLLLRGKPRLAMDHMQEIFDSAATWHHHPAPPAAAAPAPALDIAQLKGWLRQLEHDIAALLGSRRWQVGNAVIRAVEIALLRRRVTLAADYLRDVASRFNAWSPSGRERQDISQLAAWIEEIRAHLQALLGSRRWQVGDTAIGIVEKLLLRGRRPMATDHMQGIFEAFDGWQQAYYSRGMAANSSRPAPVPAAPVAPSAGPSRPSLPVPAAETASTSARSAVNVLFVLPQPIDSNCGYHALGVASRLAPLGTDCVFATPQAPGPHQETAGFTVKSFDEIKRRGAGFKDGRAADVIHAWTPREIVRKFCAGIRKQHRGNLIIHLEDNEEHLTEVTTGKSWQDLKSLSTAALDRLIGDGQFHPQHGPAWLSEADGLTMVIDTLEHFNKAGVPALALPPLVDERLFYPRPLNTALRRQLGIPDDHTVLVYTGNVHAVNREEVAMLYEAVELLNQRGCPTTLIRTGKDIEQPGPQTNVVNLGWVARHELPDILAAADCFVQPGFPGPFNDFRLPSKLPEYFAMGRPVVLPRTNLGLKVVHERDAYVLDRADAQGIAAAVRQIKEDQGLSRRLAVGAAALFRVRLDSARLGAGLAAFYEAKSLNLQPDRIMAKTA